MAMIRSVLSAFLIVSMVAACAPFDPYITPDVPRPGVVLDDQGVPQFEADRSTLQTTYVPVAAAREYARFLEDAYRQAASNETLATHAYDATLLGLALTAIGLATLADKEKAAVILGLTGTGVGIFGQRVLTTAHKRIYFQGAIAMECVIGAATRAGSEDVAVSEVYGAINGVRSALSVHEAALTAYIAAGAAQPPTEAQKQARAAVVQSAERLDSGVQDALRVAVAQLEQADSLGQFLLSRIEMIRLRVDAAVAEQEPNILTFDQSLRSAFATSFGAFNLMPAGPDLSTAKELEAFSGDKDDLADTAVEQARGVLDDARDALTIKYDHLRAVLADLPNHARVYPEGIFRDCEFSPPQNLGRLRLNTASVPLAAGVGGQVVVGISGGVPPYVVRTDVLPKGVTASISGNTLIVALGAEAAKADTVVPVLVADQDGTIALLEIKLGKARGGDASTATNDTAAATGASTAESDKALVTAVQGSLPQSLEVVADGIMGERTRSAIRTFFKAQSGELEQSVDEMSQDLKASLYVGDDFHPELVYSDDALKGSAVTPHDRDVLSLLQKFLN